MREIGGSLSGAGIVVHGGAGHFSRASDPDVRAALESGLRDALAAGWGVLADAGPALDAVVEAVAVMEASGLFNAGRGSSPTTAGAVETDASVMDGATLRTGAVCAATWPLHPVRVARAVADLGGPPDAPILLAGPGADDYARSLDAAPMRDAVPAVPASEAGTVGAVAVDAAGHVAAATSTGGREGQVGGRVGDSPIVGAGTWAHDDTAAVSATGIGEAFVIAGFAHRVDAAVRAGRDLQASMRDALAAVAALRGNGGAIGLTPAGAFRVVFDTPGMAMGWRDGTADHVAVVIAAP